MGSIPIRSTIIGDVGKLVTPVDCKSAASGTTGSTPVVSTKNSPLSAAYNRLSCWQTDPRFCYGCAVNNLAPIFAIVRATQFILVAVTLLLFICSVSSIGRARHCHCRGKGIETPTGRQYFVREWCSGNTTDFDSVVLGSIPSSRANLFRKCVWYKRRGFFFRKW